MESAGADSQATGIAIPVAAASSLLSPQTVRIRHGPATFSNLCGVLRRRTRNVRVAYANSARTRRVRVCRLRTPKRLTSGSPDTSLR